MRQTGEVLFPRHDGPGLCRMLQAYFGEQPFCEVG